MLETVALQHASPVLARPYPLRRVFTQPRPYPDIPAWLTNQFALRWRRNSLPRLKGEGTDHLRKSREGLVHTAGVTTGKVHDAKVMVNLIREQERQRRLRTADKGYASDEKKRAAEGAGALSAVKEKAKPGRDLTKRQRARNRRFGKVRAKVETCSASSNASSAIARSAIAASPKTVHRCSRSSRSPISISRAADLRPLEGKCGLNRAISTSGSLKQLKTATIVTAAIGRACYSEGPRTNSLPRPLAFYAKDLHCSNRI